MKKMNFLFYLLVVLFCACNSADDKNAKPPAMRGNQDSDVTKAEPGLVYKIDTSKQVNKLLVPRDTLLTVKLTNNKGSIRGYLSGIGRHVTLIVPVNSGDSITAQIIPDDDTANIRFNQVYIPLGKTGKYDGPFSRSISYPVSVKGNYKLIIGENLMKESDWKGNFTCNVLIK
ncbi:MAG TPA: hypothetical protein VGP55_10260 [Chitinophagaceae bacterium]|nr:hypothetical protein [Chitinophagaceae bacterium]